MTEEEKQEVKYLLQRSKKTIMDLRNEVLHTKARAFDGFMRILSMNDCQGSQVDLNWEIEKFIDRISSPDNQTNNAS